MCTNVYISAGVPAFIMGYPYTPPMAHEDPEAGFREMLIVALLFACMLVIVSSGFAPTVVMGIIIPCLVLPGWSAILRFVCCDT